MQRILLPAVLLPLAACQVTSGAGNPPAPQRPTVSVDANTTAEGSTELEFGVTIDPGDYLAAPLLFKYGFSENVELFVGGDVVRSTDMLDRDETGIGDAIVGTRFRFWEDEEREMAAAGLFQVKLPTADDGKGLGSGEIDYIGAGTVTAALGEKASLTGYAQLGLIGRPGGDDLQTVVALVPSVAIDERTGVFAELAMFQNEGPSDPMQLMLGVTRLLEVDMLADAGLVFGLNEEAPDLVLFIGLTLNLGPAAPAGGGGAAATAPEGSVRRLPDVQRP